MKYLFGCSYENKTYYQREDDVSRTDETKSSFYDIKDKQIDRFWLNGEGNRYEVDLRTGEFAINGIKFKLHDDELDDKLEGKLRLIYYRRHTHSFQGTNETSHKIEFHIGWQMTDEKGKNYKQIIRIQ